jgi:hypothetical protein
MVRGSQVDGAGVAWEGEGSSRAAGHHRGNLGYAPDDVHPVPENSI